MELVPVVRPRDLDRFIRYPFERYRNDPLWVAPLPSDEKSRLTPGKNPYFQHAEASYWMAVSGGRVAGRIAASTDRNYDAMHGERQATFGFFEAESEAAASALLQAAEEWARSRGAEVLRGPMSFTTNDECGLLVEGFARRPALLMPHNPPEYAGWIERAGFRKAKDLFSFRAPVPERVSEVMVRVARMARVRERVTVRPIAMSRFDEELARVKEVYNAAWERNWGFVPMTDAEIDHMAGQLKPAIVPDLVRFAEIDGEPVGFAMVLPDVNEALAKVRGRLFPFGIARLLWTLPRIRHGRFMALGVKRDHQKRGVGALLVEEVNEGLKRRRYEDCEIGWTLEDNEAVNDIIRECGGRRTGVYRIYEKRLAA